MGKRQQLRMQSGYLGITRVTPGLKSNQESVLLGGTVHSHVTRSPAFQNQGLGLKARSSHSPYSQEHPSNVSSR